MTWHRKIEADPQRELIRLPQSPAMQLLLPVALMIYNIGQCFHFSQSYPFGSGIFSLFQSLLLIVWLRRAFNEKNKIELSENGIIGKSIPQIRWADILSLHRVGPSLRPGNPYGVAVQMAGRPELLIQTGSAPSANESSERCRPIAVEAGPGCRW